MGGPEKIKKLRSTNALAGENLSVTPGFIVIVTILVSLGYFIVWWPF
jgi:hypothetical protein